MKRFLVLLIAIIISCSRNKSGVYSGIFTEENYLLKAEVAGKINLFNFEEGDKVNKGDTLAIIDNKEIKLMIESIEYQVKNLNIQLKNLEDDLKKTEELFRDSAISEMDFERVQRNRDMIYMELRSASASLEAKKENLKKFYVISPANGYISLKYLKTGETVLPGTPVVEILDSSSIYLNIYVSENELPKISINQSVKIRIDAFSGETFKGTVSFIAGKAEFTPRNIQTKEDRTLLVYRVKITVNNPEGKIKSGIYGDAVFE
jgi:HlyD family secretion protein